MPSHEDRIAALERQAVAADTATPNPSIILPDGSILGSGIFGNGQDGDYNLDGSTDFSGRGITLTSPNQYRLDRDIFATRIVVGPLPIVNMNVMRLFCSQSLTIKGGVLFAAGENGQAGAIGGVGGQGYGFPAGPTPSSAGRGSNGGSGVVAANGNGGVQLTQSIGGAGGQGGDSSGTVHGAGGQRILIRGVITAELPQALTGDAGGPYNGGSGGGSGASNNGLSTGGGGGGGGGTIVVAARLFDGQDGQLLANGGNGGAGSGDAGGGGGGGGGAIIICYNTLLGTGNLNTLGGSRGLGGPGGFPGVLGAAGPKVLLQTSG